MNSKMADGGRGTSHKVYKKSSSNKKITLYIVRRDLVLEPNRVERVEGVLLIDPKYADNRSLYGQIIIKIRHGREDEDMMEFDHYSESVMTMATIWPVCEQNCMNVESVQSLVKRLGPNATPFYLEISSHSPPSLILWSPKPYDGPPVGITYDIRVFLAEGPDDIVSRRNVVRMGIRVTQSADSIDTAPLLTPAPSRDSFRVRPRYDKIKKRLTSVLQFEAWLDKSSYHHGEEIIINFNIKNDSTKTVLSVEAKVMQYVNVRMFGNGKFKNVIAVAKDDNNTVPPGQTLQNFYTIIPCRVPPKNWIAIENSDNNQEGCLASTVICPPEEAKERLVYSIFVSYYVKITLVINKLGGKLSVKLPFSLSQLPLCNAPAVPEESANRPYQEENVYFDEDKDLEDNNNGNHEKYYDEVACSNGNNIEEDDSDQDGMDNAIIDELDNNKYNKFDNVDLDNGNQVTPPKIDLEEADICVNVTENQQFERLLIKVQPQVHAFKPDDN